MVGIFWNPRPRSHVRLRVDPCVICCRRLFRSRNLSLGASDSLHLVVQEMKSFISIGVGLCGPGGYEGFDLALKTALRCFQ